jgi:hypothetical protein
MINMAAQIRFWIICFRRAPSDSAPQYKQAVIPAYNALMAEAAGRALAPDAAVWTSTCNPPAGFASAAEARKHLRGTEWYSWVERL